MRLIDADRMKSNTPNWLLETDGMRKRMLYDELDWQPTISETEIIRKAFEKVVARLEEEIELVVTEFPLQGKYVKKRRAIEIVKEGAGIE